MFAQLNPTEDFCAIGGNVADSGLRIYDLDGFAKRKVANHVLLLVFLDLKLSSFFC
jgi:hypothetical protein